VRVKRATIAAAGLVKGAEHEAFGTVAAGGAVFGATLAQRIAEFLAAGPPAPTEASPQLTARVRESSNCLRRAAPMVRSRRAFRSLKTVRHNVSNVFAKLQVADRAEAVVRAREAGLGR
jgi:DNA-binding NarL/FixJ family response regulator